MEAESVFDIPDFSRGQDADEGRVLAQALGILRLCEEQVANVVNRQLQNELPFRVAAEE
jgi:hypothetical protein